MLAPSTARDSAVAALCITTPLLNAYCAGAAAVERLVNYQTWPLIPASAFARYHRAQTSAIRWTIVVPEVLGLLSQLGLLLALHDSMLRTLATWMLGASVLGIVSTLVLQIPLHRAFSRDGYSAAGMRRLLQTDWLRKGVDLTRLALSIGLLWMLLHPS